MILFKIEQVGEVLQRLYDSEINILVDSFWDIGWSWKIGDALNGFSEHVGPKSSSIASTVDGIAFAVQREYPDSDFAKWYNSLDAQSITQTA